MEALVLVYNITVPSFTLTLPINTGTIDLIDWGDGTTDISTSHTYATSNTYTVSILGTGITTFNYMFSGTGQQYLTECTSFGAIGLTDLSYMFANATSLTVVPSTLPSTVTSISGMFSGATSFNQDISTWTTTNVTNMSQMFQDATAFNQNIGSWNTANVTNMMQMFLGATAFNQNIGSWDVSNVTDMFNMFANAIAFNQNIGSWATTNVTVMNQMFLGAIAFNQNIGSWATTNVIYMSQMFQGATAFNQNIGSWNVSNVTQMIAMFQGATAFNQDISGWDTTNVQYMSSMFRGAIAFNQNIGSWTTTNVTAMIDMFRGATAFNQDISGWDVSNVQDMTDMLNNSGLSVTNYNALLNGWAAQTVQPNVPLGAQGLQYTPAGAVGRTTLTSSPNDWVITGDSPLPPLVLVYNITVSGFLLELPINTGTVTSIDWGDGTTNTSTSHTYTSDGIYTVSILGTGITTFDYDESGTGQEYLTECTSFGAIGLTNLSYMFANAINLTVVPSILPSAVTSISGMFDTAESFNQDISGWDTTNVTNMSGMFSGATSFNQNIGAWTTTNVTDMSSMFSYATSFNQNIGGWTTTSVIDMGGMFSDATAFNQNIGGWNTTNVQNMSYMFNSATSFNQNIGAWTTSSVTNMSFMFNSATSFNQNIGTWDVSNVFLMSNMLNNTSLSITNYDALLNGWAALPSLQSGVQLGAQGLTYSSSGEVGRTTLTSAPNNWTITGDTFLPPPVCFKEGSKILTDTGYKAIETLRKGDLVKTLKHGYKPIVMIGKRDIYNPAQKDRIKDQLYKCSQDKYPELTEDLIITGCHSILVNNLVTHKKIEEIKKVLGGVYFTDDKLRMPACLDEKASVYGVKGNFTIYHIALENDDYYMNYGVYANGLLVETCSKRYLKELSNMVLF
jgi:surface protein